MLQNLTHLFIIQNKHEDLVLLRSKRVFLVEYIKAIIGQN
jgi:hypothetical protein